MIQKVTTLLVVVLLGIFIAGCSTASDPVSEKGLLMDTEQGIERNSDVWTENYCGDALSVNLIAGQNENIGEVKVANDGEYLYVEFVTDDPWVLVETHVAVYKNFSEIPQTKSGNPKVGQFAYDIDSLIPLDCSWDTLYIAAHAVVEKIVGGVTVQTETAWGEGPEFPGKSWAMYFTYTVQDCCPLPPGGFSAVFAYPGPTSYWQVTLANVADGCVVDDGVFVGWCVDEGNYIYPGTVYHPVLYSSYDPNLPSYAQDPDWDMVNYILNHKQGTYEDVQAAIWYFVDGGNWPADPDAQAMINDALAHEGYVPPAGAIVAIILDLGDKVQLTIIEVPECIIDGCSII